MNRSLRTRLLLGIGVTTAIAFLLTAVTLYTSMRRGLLAEFDEKLAAKARALAVMVEQDGDEILIEFQKYRMQEFSRNFRPEYYQLWLDEEVLARSRRLDDGDLPQIAGSLNLPKYLDAALPDGRPGRCVGISFLPHVEGEILQEQGQLKSTAHDASSIDPFDFSNRRNVTLVVASETAPIDVALSSLRWLLVVVIGVSVTVLLTVLWWVVARGLRPLEQLARDIAEVDEQSLSSRFEIRDAPSELHPIIKRLNDLMARIEQAFLWEKAFTGDVAHELRTPLAGLHTTLEVALRRPRDLAEYVETIQDCQTICEDTQRMTETLLSLARIESGEAAIDEDYFDVRVLAEKAWAPFQDRAVDRRLRVKWYFETGVLLNSDPEKFRVVLSNLFDNAVSYAREGGSVHAGSMLASDGFLVEVSSSGCDLSDVQISNVFERFWRADSSRSETGSHAGLGLALCRKLITLLGATIDATSRENRFVVSIRFPSSHVVDAEASDESFVLPAGS